MRPLYIGSAGRHAGKTLLTYGLGRMIQDKGYKLGYLKPLGEEPTDIEGVAVDEDAVFMVETFKLDDPPALLSPVNLDYALCEQALAGGATGLMEKVVDAYGRLVDGKDLMIIGGAGDLAVGKMLGLDGAAVIGRLGAKALMLLGYSGMETMDMGLLVKGYLGMELAGVVINRVPSSQMDHVQERIAPYLERQGINVFGVLPKDDILGSVSVGDVVKHLGGDILTSKERLDVLVETVLVGAMNVDSAIKYFRGARNKAVVTGGDRSDILIAALETSTRALILTGGLYPDELVLAKAQEAGVPLIVVRHDTFTTLEKVRKIMGRLNVHETEKLDRASRMVASVFDLDRLLGILKG